jgi:hypothetical protein
MRTRVFSALLAAALLALWGCSSGPVNGYFVSRGLPHAVLMAHLVESPPGVLNGTLEATAVNQNGSTATVHDYNLQGTITGSNVSLRITGALATIAGWFGDAPVLVGTLEGGRLTLSHGTDTTTLWSSSQGAYLADVKGVDQEQAAIDRFNDAVQGVKAAEAYSQRVNAALDQYHAWGEVRLTRVATVKAWWTGRIRGYTRCVDRIKPLAERGVPSWRWQQCVLAIDTDSFDRDQSLKQTLALRKENADGVSRLERAIAKARDRNSAAAAQLRTVCAGASAQPQCSTLLQKWSTEEPDLVDPAKVAAFQALEPQVTSAVSADVSAATQGHATLVSLAAEADQLYRPNGS